MGDDARPGSDNDTWGAWMAAAQAGDRAAYRRLLQAIVPYIRATASRLLADPRDAEDAVQDVLIAVHEARASYDPARPFRPWLAGIARHRIIDRLRAARRRTDHETPLTEDHEGMPWSAPSRDDHGLFQALRQLSPIQRLAIERLKLGEQTLLAVAADTGLSIGTLKVATHRGVRRLRQLLKDGQLT